MNDMIHVFDMFGRSFQDWSDACEYANECALGPSFLAARSPVWLLLTIFTAITFWVAHKLLSEAPPREEVLNQPIPQSLIESPVVTDVATAGFISSINLLAQISGIQTLLFPELGALSHEVLRRPHGVWAKAPLMLVLTPFLAGLIGTLTTRHLPYGLASIFIVITVSLLVIRLLGSPITPAISAGLLPLTLGEVSWWYPPSLLIGTGLLVGVSDIRRRLAQKRADDHTFVQPVIHHENEAGADKSWIPFFVFFLVFLACAANLMDMRFLLFPPLVVIAFEMFSHASVCPWARQPLILPIVCGLTAGLAIVIVEGLGAGAMAAALSVIGGTIVLRVFSLHVPSAIAIGLLPFVMPNPDFRYSLAVISGAGLLSLSFLLWRTVSHE